MIEIVVNYDEANENFQIYESSTQTLLISNTLGEGFGNLSLFLREQKIIKTNIIDEPGILYHIDSKTFSEIIKSNISLIKRVQEIPSEFKNSANKFGTTLKQDTPKFSRGSKNFQDKHFTGFKKSGFGKSMGKFGKHA